MPIQTGLWGVWDGQDRMGQDILPEMPYVQHIGYWRLQLRHCIEPQMQEPSPKSIQACLWGRGRGRTGQDGMGHLA